jgi:hypothetical protein
MVDELTMGERENLSISSFLLGISLLPKLFPYNVCKDVMLPMLVGNVPLTGS